MQVTVFNRTFNFTNSPPFVRHAIKLITAKWGTNLFRAQKCVQLKAYNLGRLFGA